MLLDYLFHTAEMEEDTLYHRSAKKLVKLLVEVDIHAAVSRLPGRLCTLLLYTAKIQDTFWQWNCYYHR